MSSIPALFILLVALSGYIFAIQFYGTKVALQVSSGHHTFFTSIGWGIVMFALSTALFGITSSATLSSSLIYNLVNKLFPDIPADIWEYRVYLITVDSLLLAIVLPLIINSLTALKNQTSIQALHQSKLKGLSGRPEFVDIHDIMTDVELPFAITLSNRKVYIGWPYELPYLHQKEITIIPIVSGFRNEDNQRLRLITPYLELISKYEDENKEIDDFYYLKFAISIPIKEIVHVNLFDLEHYQEFQEKEEKALQRDSKIKGVKGKIARFKSKLPHQQPRNPPDNP